MKNKNELKHTPIQLESLRSELIEKTFSTNSNFLRLSLYQNYFEKILSLNNPNFEEAFLKEFLDDYLACIGKFEVWGIEPGITKKLMEQIKKISILKITSENLTSLNYEVDRIEKQLEKLNLILDGKDFEDNETRKALFPLIDKEAPEGFYGIIESVTVRINKAVVSDKFIIVPSEKEIEKKILVQCKKSWELALNLSKQYVKKPFKYHEVIISFDKKQGFYEGNSLGISLTLSFLEQILKFYNPAYVIKIKEQSAFTGGVTESGEVLCTSEEIIKRKVAAVFFSEINTFVFPKCEETYAYFALTQLKEIYPDRKLKLIPVEDINDVLNRRDVVDIKKQKLIVRSGKFIKKNWISAVATVLLAILFAYLFVMDFDDNPAIAIINGNQVFIQNKNGKVLWEKSLFFGKNLLHNPNALASQVRILDLESDGKNEVLITGVVSEKERTYDLRCYNFDGTLRWNYFFEDTVVSEREKLENQYSISLIDTITLNGAKCLALTSSSRRSFSSAIYFIDIKTRERIYGTFWASGHSGGAIIKDINKDGKKDILAIGFDNGFEDGVLFGFEIDSLTKVRPTTEDYLIRYYPVANLITYLRVKKTDFDIYNGLRTPPISGNSLRYENNTKHYYFGSSLVDDPKFSKIEYSMNENFLIDDVTIASDFRLLRDTLVSHGILEHPYTDTREFKELIINSILYWKNNKWVNRKGVEEK